MVVQISSDDVAFWKRAGIGYVLWAPTVYPASERGTVLPFAERGFDVAHIGNMRLPNNVQGLAWFVRDVLSVLRKPRPGVTLCFAGANPSDAARAIFVEAPDIVLVPNAPTADAILANGRVLVNPILSGSGVNVKSIDMLRYDAPIVTTQIGVQRFPDEIREHFVIRGFASAIAEAIARPAVPASRADVATLFQQYDLDR